MDLDERLTSALDLLSGRRRTEHFALLDAGDARSLQRTLPAVDRWHRAGRIVGFGLGRKRVDGLLTSDVACQIFVQRKRAASQVRPSERIPESIDLGPAVGRVLLDVIELDLPRLSALTDPHDVVFPGLSAGHCASGITGSIGALVRRREDPGLYVLGACHVLANSGLARRGDPIIQPGYSDGGDCPAFTIGHLDDYEPFTRGSDYPNRADLALVRLKDGARLDLERWPMRKPARREELVPGVTVLRRLGCRTGESVGLLTSLDFRTLFRHPVKEGEALFGFRELLLYHGRSASGDSGGPLVTEAGAFAGIHVGDTGSHGVGVPAWAIPDRWRLELAVN